MTSRTPNRRDEPTIRCGYCGEVEVGDTVQCDTCETWFHFECVGVTPEIAELDWSCSRCINAARRALPPDNELENGASNHALMNKAREEAELRQRLEEESKRHKDEMALQLKRFQEESQRWKDELNRAQEVASQQRAQQERKHDEEVRELRRMFAEVSNRADAPINGGVKRKTTSSMPITSSTGIRGTVSGNDNHSEFPKPPQEPFNFSFMQDARRVEAPLGRHDRTNFDLNRTQQESLLVSTQLAVTMKRQFMQKLPKFSGVPKEWAFFEAVYNSTTLEGQFSETENVFRLREALVAPALDLVLDQVMFSTDATKIMADLKEAYGRADRLIMELTKDILAIPALRRASDPKLRDLGIAMKNFTAKLKSLQRGCDLKNEYTLGMMADKLQEAPGIYKEWARRKLANPDEDLDSFAQFLMEKVSEMPPGLLPSAESTNRIRPAAPAPVRRHYAHLEAAELKNVSKIACFRCQGPHQMWKCSQFVDLSVQERRDFVKTNRICFACLNSKEHRARQCPRNFKCGVVGCGKSHNRLLHEVTNSPAEAKEDPKLHQLHEKYSSSDSDLSEGHQFSHRSTEEILYKILPVRLHGPNRRHVDTFHC